MHGHSIVSLAQVPAGEYWVQGLLHVYETLHALRWPHRQAPPDRGEGQQWSLAPGNCTAHPVRMRIDPASETLVRVSLDKKIARRCPRLADTKYIKHVRIQSERLTKFWGRPMFLGAILVLPEGWDSHPSARFPLAIFHGHFQREVFPWRETPPDPCCRRPICGGLARYCPNGHEGDLCTSYGYESVLQQCGYELYKQWTGGGFPRVIMVNIQHANPYLRRFVRGEFREPRAVWRRDHHELLPYIEKTFPRTRPVGARAVRRFDRRLGSARRAGVLPGRDTTARYANCPDPIDFRRFTNINIYEDRNAYAIEGPGERTPRPGYRDYLGQTLATIEQMNARELVLGTRSRSGGQWDIWEAVYSPVGADGYPQRIWDKATGVIDPQGGCAIGAITTISCTS